MYEDLTESLRKCGRLNMGDECICFHDGCCEAEPTCMYELMRKAADAIEELSRAQELWIEQERKMLLKSIPRWISAAERLPEDGQWVLVWGHGQHIPIMMFRESGAWIDDQFEFHSNVTHWMQLPEPPGEE